MRIANGDPMPNQTGLKPGAHSFEIAKVDPMPYVGIRPGSNRLSKVQQPKTELKFKAGVGHHRTPVRKPKNEQSSSQGLSHYCHQKPQRELADLEKS